MTIIRPDDESWDSDQGDYIAGDGPEPLVEDEDD